MFGGAWWPFSRIQARQRRKIPRWLYWSPSIIFLSKFYYVPHLITGQSMQPTLNPEHSVWRDVGIFDRYSIHTKRSYRRDDIVAVRSPQDAKRMLVKRILAVEGDLVMTLPPYPDPVVRVPTGHLWIEGDEPFHSDDSNLLGPVPAALVESKLVFILWPLNRFGRVPKPELPPLKKGPAYRHSMALFEKNLSRKARVSYDAPHVKNNDVSSSTP
ncbi:peptidase S24/S26A/S26B/S26C [Collybia nuda]|uniref:Mitochondrial inner membrane protease subunit 2 n=1 Tax=Collybia nuda TaxID=64659 RepID=A0A9P5YI57_9AGAR|nr:peptidase S24/S26A/S26B/S26C [Collybia nuda]